MRQHNDQLCKRVILIGITAAVVAVVAGIVPVCLDNRDTTKTHEDVPETQKEDEAKEPIVTTAGVATVLVNIKPATKSAVEPEPTPTAEPLYTWTADEAYMLAKMAMAEAEGEDIKGKALVILTILNRVYSDSFGNTIEAVIMEYNKNTGVYQFSSVVPGGRYWKVEPNEECYAALELVRNGWDESQGALYFERTNTESTWHSRNLKKLFIYGVHTFYAKKEVAAE